MKKLPIGIQTFAEIIQEEYPYVDKTRHIAELIQAGKYFFLSRPRRFGKSLLISTLRELFLGHQALFKGLFIYDKIAWQPHPVIEMDFSTFDQATEMELRESLSRSLDRINTIHQLDVDPQGFKTYFHTIISRLYEKYGKKVVILIDEYDKPITDWIDDMPKARIYQELLRDFYLVLKGSDRYLHFVLITGVSKFSRISVFSGLNNLQDITLSPQFATLLGYTQAELESYFAEHLHALATEQGLTLAQLLTHIKTWYNGYSWNAIERLYNPFSILNLLAQQRFSNYWFASATPTFLIKWIKNTQIDIVEFENKKVSDLVFDSYEIDNLNIFSLLFQTGYLTITHIEQSARLLRQYTLNYPNLEVKEAFITYLLASFTQNRLDEIQPAADDLITYLREERLEAFINLMTALFAKIPYPLHIQQEAYYHSLFYMILVLMGVEIDLEVLTDKGRIDGVLSFDDKVYLIEFKYGKKGTQVDTLIEQALWQIQTKGYQERFLNDPRPCLLLAVVFIDKTIFYKKANHERTLNHL